MHAGTVVGEDRLRHEGRDLAVRLRRVADHVLVGLDVVAHRGQRVEPHVDLALTGGADLVVMDLDRDAERLHREDHLGAEIHQGVVRRHRVIPALRADLVAQVRSLVRAGVPEPFDRIDLVEAALVGVGVAHVVEHEELRLRTHVDRIADAGAAEVRLGALRDTAGVLGIARAGDRLIDIADHVHRGHGGIRVEPGRGRVRHHQHVGLVDRLEAADRGAVEPDAVGEDVLVDVRDALGGVLPGAEEIDEAEIENFDSGLFGHVHDIGRRVRHVWSPRTCNASHRPQPDR